MPRLPIQIIDLHAARAGPLDDSLECIGADVESQIGEVGADNSSADEQFQFALLCGC